MRTLLAAALLAAAAPCFAETPDHDPGVARQLTGLGIKYEVDADGDFRVVYEEGDDGERSQLVIVRTPVEEYGALRVREVWAPGYEAKGESFPADVANRLLEDSQTSKLGGWVKQGRYAMFVVKIAADAPPEELRAAMEAASARADEVERELAPGTDEF